MARTGRSLVRTSTLACIPMVVRACCSARRAAATSLQLAAMAALLSACSWFLVGAPASRPPNVSVSCTESKAAPVVDTGLALIGGIAALLALVSPCDDELCRLGQVMIGVPGAVGALVFGLSASSGYRTTAACRRSHAATLAWASVHDPAAGTGEGEVCRAAWPPCDSPLFCVAGRCRRVPGALGNTCKSLQPSVSTSGYCDGRLVCRAGMCVEP